MLMDETEQRNSKLKFEYEGNFRGSSCQSSSQNASGCLGIGSVVLLPHRAKGTRFSPPEEGGKITGDSSLKEINKLAREGFVPQWECGFPLVGDETEHLTKGWFPFYILTQNCQFISPVHLDGVPCLPSHLGGKPIKKHINPNLEETNTRQFSL